MDDRTLLSIGQIAERSGFPASTIRYYEERGLVRADTRVGGRRRFNEAILHRLAVIDLLRTAGFSLREIGELLRGRRSRWRLRATRKLEEVEQRIERARMARRILRAALLCDCDQLDGCQVAVRTGSEIRRH